MIDAHFFNGMTEIGVLLLPVAPAEGDHLTMPGGRPPVWEVERLNWRYDIPCGTGPQRVDVFVRWATR
jgi:hypothetical protein